MSKTGNVQDQQYVGLHSQESIEPISVCRQYAADVSSGPIIWLISDMASN